MSEFAQLENTAAAILQEKNRQARREKLILKIFLYILMGAIAIVLLFPYFYICLLYTSPSPRDRG